MTQTVEPKHCDEYIRDRTQPMCLRRFLCLNRMPACRKYEGIEKKGWKEAVLFANYRGKRVRITMASRFGDVGITTTLSACSGYDTRVAVEELSNFSEEK